MVHHSHTDLGYTSHPDVVEEKHLEFIDQAIDLCAGNDARPPGLRYRWTCESSWVVYRYFLKRSPSRWKAFLQAVERADIEVTAIPLQPTPLVDAGTIRASLKILDVLREEGIPISIAMTGDINGLNWPWAEVLLDAGIEGLGTAMNLVCGGGMPRLTGFHWTSHKGRSLLCWQGTHYNQGAYWGLNHSVYTSNAVGPERIAELRDYPYENLLLQVTNIPPDNMGPHPDYLNYLERYNAISVQNDWPRMRTATMREWFDFLKESANQLPSYKGEWSDWWASGVASTPRETAALLEAQRRMGMVERMAANPHCIHLSPSGAESNNECWSNVSAGARKQTREGACAPGSTQAVREKIFLAAEHTWGASTSVKSPWMLSSVAGLAAKQNIMYQAAYAANELFGRVLEPEYALCDPKFGSFDPLWKQTAEADLLMKEKHPFYAAKPSAADYDWSQWLGRDFGQVIQEEPADGKRSTWFETGRSHRPESHGKWPDHPQWKRNPVEDGERDIVYEGDVARIRLSFSIETKGEPRAFYIRFPFLQVARSVWAEVGGAWANPRDENIPGSCHNWWTVHGGVLMVGDEASWLWTSWDAPLVMFDEICPNPPKEKNILSVPTLVSWAYHNYWATNFSAVHQGEVTFRYRVKYWPGRVTTDEVNAYLESDPLPQYPDAVRR